MRLSVPTIALGPLTFDLVIARLERELVDPRTYGRIGYLLVAGLLGVTEFVFLVVAISVGVGLAITLIGIPILILAVYAWGGLAEGERRIIAALTGKVIPNPYRPVPEDASRWGRLRARLADPATWKDLTFLLLQFPFGLVSFLLAVCILSIGIHLVALPLWYWAVPGGVDDGIITVDQLWEAVALVPLGVAILLLGIPALSALGRLYVSYAEVLLGSNVDPAVTAQMTDLRDARSRIIEAADAERRRIERDLHDGAQQRLVALALTLRMAEKRAGEGNPEAATLVHQAGEEAGLALKELRDLARGIHPAILTNRGLPAALDDLAGRASVPVEVVATPPERLPDQVEAAAYFVVSECLANIGKHAQATAAEVSVTPRDGHLLVTVSDDGVGGAKLDGGSGLQGLQDRVGALNGTLAVESGPSGGTRVLATIPLVERVETSPFAPALQRVLSDEEAEQLQRAPPQGPAHTGVATRDGGAGDRRGLGPDGRAERVACVAAAGPGAGGRTGRLAGAGHPARAALGARRRAQPARLSAAPRGASGGRQARDPQRVPDRDLAGGRGRLLLAGVGDAGLRRRARAEGGPVAAQLDGAGTGLAARARQWPQPSACSCTTVSWPLSPVRMRTAISTG